MVEDEKYMAEAVAAVLKKNNYSVDLAYDGEYGLDCGLTGIYDVIILDIMLPKMDGIAVVRQLRGHGIATPVILLTAKGETADKVRGLDSGADDYLPKPFKTEELLARLRALGRRRGALCHDGILRCGDVALHPHDLILACGNGSLNLTRKESQMLELLIGHQSNVVPKDLMIEKLWGFETEAEDNHVEVYISFLRKKLDHLKANVYIQTVRGVGYALKQK